MVRSTKVIKNAIVDRGWWYPTVVVSSAASDCVADGNGNDKHKRTYSNNGNDKHKRTYSTTSSSLGISPLVDYAPLTPTGKEKTVSL